MMRSVLLSLAAVAMAGSALAADPAEDMPYLRGSEPYEPPAYKTYTRWSGWYAGGHMEYADAHFDFTRATRSLIAFDLRELSLESEQHVSNWQVLTRQDISGAGFGAFAGYNTQWEDVVLGIEVSYSRNSFSGTAPHFPITRATAAGGNAYIVTLDGAATAQLNDYATIKGRAGYVMGNFMPYVTLGLAVGRLDFTRSSLVFGTENPNTVNAVPFNFASSEARSNAITVGWALGAGVDICLWNNVFLRAEYEHVAFSPLSGIVVSLDAGRLGAGVKF